jgi:uncharacterized protein (DUF1015 family)
MPGPQLQAKIVRDPIAGYRNIDSAHNAESRVEMNYENVAENLNDFLEAQIPEIDTCPCIYVYQVVHQAGSQVGIWTLTHINDYTSGKIKKHELTIPARENMLADYLIKTGKDANPVLLTYLPSAVVDGIITKYMSLAPRIKLGMNDGSRHSIWRIYEPDDLRILCNAFYNMQSVYIADGHHRVASMAKMAIEKRRLNSGKHTGEEAYNYFSSVYMNTANVRVLEYNRLVRDLGGQSPERLLTRLAALFVLEALSTSFKPEAQHEIGMYMDRTWYKLSLFSSLIDQNDPVEQLGVSILQSHILGPILNISDPRTDLRLSFESGLKTPEQLEGYVNGGAFRIAFILQPISIMQVIKVAEANLTMPPKSTWVEPKFPVGLLTSYFG